MAENSIKQIKEYLGCTTQELMVVWKELSEEEKVQWKAEELPES